MKPESIPAKTVEVVCLTTLTFTKKKPASLTKEFPRFKSQGQVSPIELAELQEALAELLPQFLYICLNITFLIGYFKATTKVNKLQFPKVLGGIKEDFSGVEEDIYIQDIATCVHVNPIDVHFGILYNTQNMRYLVNTYTKLTIYMPYRNLRVASSHNMWIDADTYRYLWVLAAELFQDGKVVYVELYPPEKQPPQSPP